MRPDSILTVPSPDHFTVSAEEQWVEVPGFPDYRVSNHGRVKSLKYGKERVLRARSGDSVGVMLSQDGRVRHRQVRTLVLEAFVGPGPSGARAMHLDGDKFNNRLENLAWITPGSDACSKADE